MQQIGETRDAILEQDEKTFQEILNANKHRDEPYWVVIFAKPSKVLVEGKPALAKHMKAYGKKPISQVGMITAEIHNKTGEIKWEINLPQAPFDYSRVPGSKACDDVVVETTTIAGAYITQ